MRSNAIDWVSEESIKKYNADLTVAQGGQGDVDLVLDAASFSKINGDKFRWRDRLINVLVQTQKGLHKILAFRGYDSRLNDGVNNQEAALDKYK